MPNKNIFFNKMDSIVCQCFLLPINYLKIKSNLLLSKIEIEQILNWQNVKNTLSFIFEFIQIFRQPEYNIYNVSSLPPEDDLHSKYQTQKRSDLGVSPLLLDSHLSFIILRDSLNEIITYISWTFPIFLLIKPGEEKSFSQYINNAGSWKHLIMMLIIPRKIL